MNLRIVHCMTAPLTTAIMDQVADHLARYPETPSAAVSNTETRIEAALAKAKEERPDAGFLIQWERARDLDPEAFAD